MTDKEYNKKYNVTAASRLAAEFSYTEVKEFLEKKGYRVFEHEAPGSQRIYGGMAQDPEYITTVRALQTKMIALKEGEEPPKEWADDYSGRAYGIWGVFQEEMKKALLKL